MPDPKSVPHPSDPSVPESTKHTAASRLLSLLGAFSRGGGSLTLSEISRYAGLPLTTTHRLTHEVLDWGGLESDGRGHYRLSSKILDLAATSTQAFLLRERALPHLLDLHRRTGLTVHLGVRDAGHVMYLEALRSHPNYTGANRIGGRLPLHVTATGLVLLAYADETVVDEYLRQPLKRYTEYTVVDPKAIRELLAAIRERRRVVAERILTPFIGAIGAPIAGDDGDVRAAVGLTFRIGTHDPNSMIPLIGDAAARITRAVNKAMAALESRSVNGDRVSLAGDATRISSSSATASNRAP